MKNNLITKLSSIAALIGVIAAIGGGFVQYGKIQAKLTELDKRKPVINQTVDLGPINEKISSLEVALIDRIKRTDDKISAPDFTPVYEKISDVEGKIKDLTPIEQQVISILEEISVIEDNLSELMKEVAVAQKENQLQDILIEEIKEKGNNPLAN
jgi:DNA repair ATPase RecN